MSQHLPTPTRTNAWENSGSLGFGVWRRHTSAILAAGNPLMRQRQNSLLTVYNRHSSFTNGLIARQFNQGGSGSDASRFVFSVGQYQRQRYMSEAPRPDTHTLLAKRQFPSGDMSRDISMPAVQRSLSPNTLSGPTTGEASRAPLLSRKATIVKEASPSSPRRSTAPPDVLASLNVASADTSSDKGRAGSTVNKEAYLPPAFAPVHSVIHRSISISALEAHNHERLAVRSSGHIARKALLSDPSQRFASNATTRYTSDTIYRAAHPDSRVNLRQGSIQAPLAGQALMRTFAPLSVRLAAENRGSVGKSTGLPDGSLPPMIARRPAVAMSHHSSDLQTSGHLPLTPVPVARQLQRSGSGRAEEQPLYANPRYAPPRPASPPAIYEAIRRKTTNVNLLESKSEMKSVPSLTSADGSIAESPSSPAVEFESSRPSEPSVSTATIPAPSSTSLSGFPLGPRSYVLRRHVLRRSLGSLLLAGDIATVSTPDSGPALRPLPGSKILSRQLSSASNRSLPQSTPLHLTAPSRLMRSALPASHSLPGASHDFPRAHALPPPAALQPKQPQGMQLPQLRREPLASPETSVQRTAAGTESDPASAVITKSIPQPASPTIARVDVGRAPDVHTAHTTLPGFATYMALSQTSAQGLTAQRLPGKTGPLALHRKAISTHRPAAASEASMSRPSVGELSASSLRPPASLPANSAIRLSRHILRRPLEAALPGTHALGIALNQDSATNFHGSRQAISSSPGMIMTNEHHAEPGVPYILRRVDRSPSPGNPPTDASGNSTAQMTSLHHPELIASSSRSTSTPLADLQANRIACPTAEHVTYVSYPLNTISGSSLNVPVSRTSAQRLPGNQNTIRLSFPHAISRRATDGTLGRSAGTEELGITNASASGKAETFGEQPPVIYSREASSPHTNWTQGFAERPLVRIQRAQTRIMRASDETVSVMRNPAQPEDHYGLVSPPNEASGQTQVTPGETARSAGSAPEAPDPEEIAEQTWRMIVERLVIEQERRGLTKWL